MSPRPGNRAQHQPQIPLPFASDSGIIAVSDREKLHELLSALLVILFVLDRNAILTTLEGKGVSLLPSLQQSMVGRHFLELYPDNSETRKHLAEALAGTAVSWAGQLGEHVFVTTLTPVRDRADAVTGLLGIGIVTSNNGRMAESGENADQSAAGTSPLKNHLFAQVSHELRTPLNSIVGFAHLLLNNKESHLDEQDLFYLQRITGNATHLLGVVGDMMDLTVIETGKAKIVVSEVDLAGLIRETIAEIRGGSGSVELHAEIPENARPIETDRQKLKQILINLLANALKYTQHGSVTVIVGLDEFLRPVRIDVRDTGMGIQAENLEAIFDAFDRGKQGAGQEIEGTGLGLTVTRALCGLLGYTIRVVSEPGKGSTFTIDCSRTPPSQSR
jgi:signal transduction histidine kinase